jgi:1-aminocyclopropane-1-carboxylate deaminase
MSSISPGNIRTQRIKNLYQGSAVEMDVLRLDLIHPVVSGNKWFKLQHYIDAALDQKKKGIATYGGYWSNHIVATAAACNDAGLSSIGMIRGEEPAEYSVTLQQAKEYGMQFLFMSRNDYKEKKRPTNLFEEEWLIVPEGGYGLQGAMGAASILTHADSGYTDIVTAVGTGTTLAGLTLAAENARTIGVSVLKNNYSLNEEINALLPLEKQNRFLLLHDHDRGGYAKHDPELLAFMNKFYEETSIPTDFVYTGKVFLAVDRLIQSGFFIKNAKILVIHTGGLQGNRSLPKGTLIF